MIENPCRGIFIFPHEKHRALIFRSIFTRPYLFTIVLPFSERWSFIPGGKFTINEDCLREQSITGGSSIRWAVSLSRSSNRTEAVQRSEIPSVDAISDDELFAIKRDATTWQSDEQRRNCYEALVGGALESRVLDRSGGSGSYGVALKPTYRLFFLWRNPPVNGSVL